MQELLSAPVIRKFRASGSAGGNVSSGAGGVVDSAAGAVSPASGTVVAGRPSPMVVPIETSGRSTLARLLP